MMVTTTNDDAIAGPATDPGSVEELGLSVAEVSSIDAAEAQMRKILAAQPTVKVLVPVAECGPGGLAVIINGVRMTVPADVVVDVPEQVGALIAARLAGPRKASGAR